MQILYVGNGNYKYHGARYYEPGRKIVNGLVRAGHNVYFFSDRDTARPAKLFGIRSLGIKRCNQVFLTICENFRPDLVVFMHADFISNDSIEAARAMLPHMKMAQFNVDPVFRPHNRAMINTKLPYMDATFVTTAGPVLKRFHREGARASFVPNAVDSSMEWPRCHERSDQAYDVFWAQRALRGSYEGDPRIALPLFLEQSGQVSMYYRGMNHKPELFGAPYYHAIANARMGLNISVDRTWGESPRASDEELYLYSSDRLSHYMGSGLLTFTTRDNRMEDLFAEDQEIVMFGSKEELLEKVVYYKMHDAARRAIARAGWEKSHRHFNSTLVAKYMVETTFGLPLSEAYAWPVDTY